MVGITVAVGVGIEMVAGVTMGRMLARGGGLLPGEGAGLAWAPPPTEVGLMLAVGGSDEQELREREGRREKGGRERGRGMTRRRVGESGGGMTRWTVG